MTVGGGAKLERAAHADLPWRVHDVAPDFELVDAWAVPASGTIDEFDDLCRVFAEFDPGSDRGPSPSSALFAVRRWLGRRFGWDEDVNTQPIPGCVETSLRERLPSDLHAEAEETAGRLPFRPVFRTEDEWALELSNATGHAILHLGWVAQPDRTYRGQLGVYMKHRGRLGRPYLTAIAPFRHHVVYPALLRRVERAWQSREPRQAIVAVIGDGDRLLWIKRGPGAVRPGYWTPPTGTVERGESAEEAVVREMAEELGIVVRPIRSVWQCPTEGAGFLLDWWLTELESGEPRPASDEVAELRWVTAVEIHELSPTFASHLTFVDEVWPTLAEP